MDFRHLATAPALAITLLSASPANAQTAAVDQPLAAPARDHADATNPASKAVSAPELFNLFLGVGTVSGNDFRMAQGGRSYSAKAETSPVATVSICRRFSGGCVGLSGGYSAPARVRTMDGLDLITKVTVSSFDQALFLRLDLGTNVRFRPFFAMVLGTDVLTLPEATFSGWRMDTKVGFDVAFPIGKHALVLQGGGSLPLASTGMTAEESGTALRPIDLTREPSAFVSIGPELRL